MKFEGHPADILTLLGLPENENLKVKNYVCKYQLFSHAFLFTLVLDQLTVVQEQPVMITFLVMRVQNTLKFIVNCHACLENRP